METLQEIENKAEAELDRLYARHKIEREKIIKEAILALGSAKTPEELISIDKENKKKFRILANEQKDEYAQVCERYPKAFSL